MVRTIYFETGLRGAIAGLLAVVSVALEAAELLVVEDPACGPCILFDRQVGRIYPKTDEAAVAPLRRIPYGAPAPEPYAFIGESKVAPTFVLVEGGRELGRFEGYSSDELFWMNLTALLHELEPRTQQDAR